MAAIPTGSESCAVERHLRDFTHRAEVKKADFRRVGGVKLDSIDRLPSRKRQVRRACRDPPVRPSGVSLWNPFMWSKSTCHAPAISCAPASEGMASRAGVFSAAFSNTITRDSAGSRRNVRALGASSHASKRRVPVSGSHAHGARPVVRKRAFTVAAFSRLLLTTKNTSRSPAL